MIFSRTKSPTKFSKRKYITDALKITIFLKILKILIWFGETQILFITTTILITSLLNCMKIEIRNVH